MIYSETKCRKCGDKYIPIAGQVPFFYCLDCIEMSNNRVDKLKLRYGLTPKQESSNGRSE